MSTRPLEQLQMLSNVVEFYAPSNRSEYKEARNGSFLGLLPTMDLSSPVVGNAVDSLCLAHFASQSNNRSLLLASQASYGKTLNALAFELSSPGRRYRSHRSTLYGIMVISLYGASQTFGDWQQNDWEIHYWGVHQYLQSVGPTALDLQNEFDSRLYLNLRGPLFFLALARRRPCVFAQIDWAHASRVALRHKIDVPASAAWVEISVQLPGLLAHADQLLSSYQGGNVAPLLKAFHLIDNICYELIEWSIQKEATSMPKKVTLQDTEDLDPAIEEHSFIVTSDVFQEFWLYPSITTNVYISLVWLMCMIGRCTLLRFFDVKQFSELQLPETTKTIEDQAFSHAQNLCAMVVSFSKLSSVANAHYLCVFLKLARSFFDELGAHKESDWCRACIDATARRIKRIEKTEPPTVCRIASLGMSESLLLSHVRYRRA